MEEFLQKEGLTFTDLSMIVRDKQFTVDEARHIFREGKEKGVAEERQAHPQRGQRTLSADYFADDGRPRWSEMVAFCQQNQAGLSPKEQEFLDELPSKLRWRPPSRPMGGFLLSIFWKLRGSLQ